MTGKPLRAMRRPCLSEHGHVRELLGRRFLFEDFELNLVERGSPALPTALLENTCVWAPASFNLLPG